MPSLTDPPAGQPGQQYWRSLDHLADTPEFRAFMHREFPAGATELLLDSGERRHFLKIMGASMALAGFGLAGCRRWPAESIVPYASRPEGHDPGVAMHYATCAELGGVARGLIATSHDGRPTKIEGNPDHPTSLGAADIFAQASILDLYDPDRSRAPVHEGAASTWDAFAAFAGPHFKGIRARRGAGVAVLAEASSSPSLAALKRRFLEACPNASWHEYEPINNDEIVAGSEMAFGQPQRTQLDLTAARVIVSLDADILGVHPNAVQNIRQFARGRRPDDGGMNRLYAFESDLTVTGANADHRAAVRTRDVAIIASAIAARVTGDEALARLVRDPAVAATITPAVAEVIDHAVADLQSAGSASLVVAGWRQPAEVHLLAHVINDTLGAAGHTVRYTPQRGQTRHVASLRALASTKPRTLLIIGGNPVYDAPADVDVAGLIGGAKVSIHLSDSVNETSAACTWHLNRAHYLETWGDGRAWDGTYSVAQPLIEPLFDGRSPLELMALANGDLETDGEAIVRATFDEMVGAGDDRRWRQALRDGVLPGSGFTAAAPAARRNAIGDAIDGLMQRWQANHDGWEVTFAAHPTVYDGRFGNNGWLQEVPDPISKLTWDNAVLLSPAAAESLDLDTGDRVTVNAGGVSVDAAVMRMPGIADRSAVLHLGYGRGFAGRVCTGAGFDFYPLRTAATMATAPATLAKARGHYPLAGTQDHHTVDVESVGGRGVQDRLPSLFREATLDHYLEHPRFAHDAAHTGAHVLHRLSTWEATNLDGADHAWAMTIDLNSCVGCGACIVACQAENNIPIVGKDQVLRGREMHWIRIDRYFTFGRTADGWDPDAVRNVALQPVTCMMCENAPCEQVCPVAATVHDKNGLNVMVYNRCVGTRYCSNNCPYKVRRFNYFDFRRRGPLREQPGLLLQVEPEYFNRAQSTSDSPLPEMQFNPDVTVRMRGVMEKCTYCVQRIMDAKITAKNAYANRSESEKAALKDQRIGVPDGSITPACAQTCPGEAIVFGDLHDTTSRVARLHQGPRAYEMLEELHVKARTKYLAKVRNPGYLPEGSSDEPAHRESEGAAHS